MITRFVSLAIIALAALLGGCAGYPMRYDVGGVHYGRNTIAGHVSGIAGTSGVPVQYGAPVAVGMPIVGYAGSNPYSPEACPAGYRHINGVYRCMGGGFASPVYSNGPMVQSVVVPAKCDFGNGDVRYTFEGQAACDKIAAGMTRQVSGKVVFSNEGSGAGICRLRSDGTARLKTNPSQPVPRGEVLAISEKTVDSGTASVIAAQSNEDCSAWRRRVAGLVVWR